MTEKLGKIMKAFPQWPPSTTTDGNASQIADGSAALLMMKRSTAEMLGQPILAKFVASIVPVPKLLQKVGLGIAFRSTLCITYG